MTDETPTTDTITAEVDLRALWHDAVAEANAAVDRLDLARTAPTPDERYIKKCEEILAKAQAAVDDAYKAYVSDNQNWVSESPGRFDLVVVPSFIPTSDGAFPSVTFSFSAGTDLEPITVTLVNDELEMRRFQRNISRAFDMSVRRTRQRNRETSTSDDEVARMKEAPGDES